MKDLFRQIFRLSAADKWFLCKAVFLSVFIRIWLKLINFKTIKAFLSSFTGKIVRNEPVFNVHKYHHLITLCRCSTRGLTNCLSVSLAFWTMLKRRGIETSLVFGMIKEHEKLKAHAWLEYRGASFGEIDINLKYIPFKDAIL